MGKIVLETFIQAPSDRCFDLCRSVGLHTQSTVQTKEKAVKGKTSGLLGLNDVVTWEARHFGITQHLTVQITAYERPKYFRDSQILGIFKRFDHDHVFEAKDGGTMMIDTLDFVCPLGVLGKVANFFVSRHLENFLRTRNLEIKRVAENNDWRAFVS